MLNNEGRILPTMLVSVPSENIHIQGILLLPDFRVEANSNLNILKNRIFSTYSYF